MASNLSLSNKRISEPSKFDVDKANVTQLRSFLRDHGLHVSGSKYELILRAKGALDLGKLPLQEIRIHDENEKTKRQIEKLISPLGEKLPEISLLQSGWSKDVELIPAFRENDLYNYLVLNDSRTTDGKPINAKKQLKAKVFYTDRHLHSVEYHEISMTISHCYVKAKCIRSFPSAGKKENNKYGPEYCVWVCLSKNSGRAHAAGCQCAAGEGESCNHIAALMCALVDITEKKKEGLTASTSNTCPWNRPRAKILSPKKVSDLVFKKQKLCMTETSVDPKLKEKEYKTPVKEKPNPVNIHRFCDKLQQCNPHAAFLLSNVNTLSKFKKPANACSLKINDTEKLSLPSPPFMFMDSVDTSCTIAKVAFQRYIENISISEDQCKVIETLTRKQSLNKNWSNARCGRITSSNFGQVCKRKEEVVPVSILKNIMGYTSFQCASVMWGRSHEPAARRIYCKILRECHPGINVTECGLLVSPQIPYLGCSPDGIVHCPHCVDKENGLLEIKCPYKYRNVSPMTAAENKDFFCEIVDGQLKLKHSHNYFYQIQGQLGITGRKWCDFLVWTLEGHSVERIEFDPCFWNECVQKLKHFFEQYIVPEIFTRRIHRSISL